MTELGLSPAPADRIELGLSAYLLEVGMTIKRNGPLPAWVQCEIAKVTKKPDGRVYLQLVEADSADGEARVESVVWPERAAAVLGRFATETGTEMAKGMRVLLRVAPNFSPRWGFILFILDSDPAWTVGAAKLVADGIRRHIFDEGISDRNRALSAPEDFTSVAVIAPNGSDALEDFMAEARALEEHGLCRIVIHPVTFEGPSAGAAVASALRAATADRRHDAIFIIRGGGAATALAWLNDEDAVRAVCLSKVPVITGIGHENDRVLLDEVANRAFGTPSKAALHLVDTVVDRAREATVAWEDICASARAAVAANRSSIDALLREAVGLGPSATLARGYAVIAADGKSVSSAAAASRQKRLVARFYDGTINLQNANGIEH